MLTLVEDIQALKPTIFASVPRLWNRIYGERHPTWANTLHAPRSHLARPGTSASEPSLADKVMAAVSESGQIAKLLFDTAFQNRLRGIERGQRPSGVIGDASRGAGRPPDALSLPWNSK